MFYSCYLDYYCYSCYLHIQINTLPYYIRVQQKKSFILHQLVDFMLYTLGIAHTHTAFLKSHSRS